MDGRGGKSGTMCFQQAGRTIATGLQVWPGLQAISVCACSCVIAHRITLAGLFLPHLAISDVGDLLAFCSSALFVEESQLGQATRCFTFLPD